MQIEWRCAIASERLLWRNDCSGVLSQWKDVVRDAAGSASQSPERQDISVLACSPGNAATGRMCFRRPTCTLSLVLAAAGTILPSESLRFHRLETGKYDVLASSICSPPRGSSDCDGAAGVDNRKGVHVGCMLPAVALSGSSKGVYLSTCAPKDKSIASASCHSTSTALAASPLWPRWRQHRGPLFVDTVTIPADSVLATIMAMLMR